MDTANDWKSTFRITLKRLFRPLGLIYIGVLTLLMGLLSIWLNWMELSPSFAEHFPYLCLYLALGLPVCTFGVRFDEGKVLGTCVAYLMFHVISCVALLPFIAIASLNIVSICAWFGFLLTGICLMSLCLGLNAWIKNKYIALITSLIVLAVCREVPELIEPLTLFPQGIPIARTLIELSPFNIMTPFINGIFDVSSLSYALAIIGFFLAVICVKPARLTAFLGFIACCVALFFVPKSIAHIDCTPQHLVTIDEYMASVLTMLDRDITIYQVAPVGVEDIWMQSYLSKISERHRHIGYETVAPIQNKSIEELGLPDNTLIIELDEEWFILRPEQIHFQTEENPPRYLYALQGALLAALEEATQITFTYWSEPTTWDMTIIPLDISDTALRPRVIGCVLYPCTYFALALGIAIKNKRRNTKENTAK